MAVYTGSSGGTGVALAARFAAGGSCTGDLPMKDICTQYCSEGIRC